MADWKSRPESLVGERITVQWKDGRHEGKVTKYSHAGRVHTVEYDDGDIKVYDMASKTFWLKDGTEFRPTQNTNSSSNSTWDAQNKQGGSSSYFSSSSAYDSGGYYGGAYDSYSYGGWGNASTTYTAKWTEYRSKTADARTEVTFHVVVDPRALIPGDRVILKGNTQSLTAWGDGVPLEQDPIDSNIWFCTVIMPFSWADFSKDGIFQFNYSIVSERDEVISEGQQERTEDRLQRYFYHSFRSNYRYPRFRGWVTVSGKVQLQVFTQRELTLYETEQISMPELLHRFICIATNTNGAHRSHVEELIEEFAVQHAKSRQAVPVSTWIAFSGMIGHFGRTSEETYYVGGTNNYTYQWNSAGTQTGVRLVNRTPPKPKSWCWELVGNMPVSEWLSFSFKEIGVLNSRKVAQGVAEAVERIAEEGSFQWLRVMPFLEQYNLQPRVPDNVSVAFINRFHEAAKELVQLAELEFSRGKSEAEMQAKQKYEERQQVAKKAKYEASTDDVIGLGGMEGLDLNLEDVDTEPAPLRLAKGWMRTLVAYAPTISVLSSLCCGSLKEHLGDVMQTCVQKIKEFIFSENDASLLAVLIHEVPALQNVKVATAILQNSSLDDQIEQVVGLVGNAIQIEYALEKAELSKNFELAADPSATSAVPLEGKWLDLNSAAKAWLYRLHGEEPAIVKRANAPAPVAVKETGGWFNYGAKKTAPNPTLRPSEDTVIKERKEKLVAAIRCADLLMKMDFFLQHSRGLVFELSRCWFMNGDKFHQLSAFCAIGSRGQGFSAFCSPITEFLTDTIQKTVKLCSRPDYSVAMGIMFDSFSPDHILCHQLLYVLATTVTWSYEQPTLADPPLLSILQNQKMWSKLFERFGRGRLDTSALATILDSVQDTLKKVVSSLEKNTIQLQALHAVLDFEQEFLELSKQIGVKSDSVSVHRLATLRSNLFDFDTKLEHVQCYASFFCGCGVKIHVTEIRQKVEQLREQYKTLQSDQIESAFSDIQALSHLSWLFDLRSSELFLAVWRETGKEVIHDQVEGAKNALLMENEQDEVAGFGDLFAVPADQELTEEQRIQEAEQRIRDDLARQEAEFQRRDRLEQLLAEIEDVILSQYQVCNEVIPRAKTMWESLADSVCNGSISVDRLGQSFGKLVDESLVKKELHCLLSTATNTRSISSAEVTQCLCKLEDYTLLNNLCKWLPNLLRLHNIVADLCETPPNLDPLHQQLKAAMDNIDRNWDGLTLSSVPDLIQQVRPVFHSYTKNQLDFLSTLATSSSFLKWLLQHASTEEFNRLLQVCRPCTDEPRLLSSIASLVHVRTLLLQPLYLDPKFDNFQAFLTSFAAVDIEGTDGQNGMWHLENIIQSFDGLIDVFEKQTRSPGIKSCYELKELLAKGVFVFSVNSDITKVLHVEITTIKDDHDEPAVTKVESLEFLLDLRSKLLMTEIPQELEDEMQASTLVEAFVQQLQVLSEISDAIFSLYSAGHVDYQQGYSQQYKFEMQGLDHLLSLLSSLQAQALAWTKNVKDARDTFYFLNFYTMQEILKFKSLVEQWQSVPATEESPIIDLVTADEPDIPLQKRTPPITNVGEQTFRVVCSNGVRVRSQPDLISPQVGRLEFDDICIVVPADSKYANDDLVQSGKVVHVVQPEDGYITVRAENGDLFVELICNNDVDFTSEPGFSEDQGMQSVVSVDVESMIQMGFSKEWAEVALARCNNQVEQAVDFCFSQSQFMDRIVEEHKALRSRSGRFKHDTNQLLETPAENEEKQHDPLLELFALLHLVSSTVDKERAMEAVKRFTLLLDQKLPLLFSLGEMLYDIFGKDGDEMASLLPVRHVPLPSEMALNRADMLINVDDGDEHKLPIFVTVTDSPNLVIDSVLSVYCRRGRLPEPSEILFCTTQTTKEDLQLLLLRFIKASSHGRATNVWAIADVHNLSYTLQCTLVEKLRSVLVEYGTNNASTLLIVSGKPRQVVLNSLSSHWVESPPLQETELRRALAQVFRVHHGETFAVTSEINGGGKSDWILRQVSKRQHNGMPLIYRRVPLRESSTPRSIVQLLAAAHGAHLCPKDVHEDALQRAFHIDVAHIIPAAANVILFQLLVVGTLRDPVECRVYATHKMDIFFIEIPNSIGNKTAMALRFCSLLPTKLLVVNSEQLKLTCPIFSDRLCTKISLSPYDELKFVCKWIRAFRSKCFKPNSGVDFNIWSDRDISGSECFNILKELCCAEGSPSPRPSWSLFRGFVLFMNQQFTFVESYPLLAGSVLSQTEGLAEFKHVFIHLLIETSRDFSLRSVAQVPGVGPDPSNEALPDGGVDMMPEPPAALPSLLNRSSLSGSLIVSQSIRVLEAQHTADADGVLEELVQEDRDMVSRFQTLASWESSDHPVVVFKPDSRGGVSGVDILSLNHSFLNQYIDRELSAGLQHNKIKLDRDWEKLTNEEAVELLRAVEGLEFGDRGGLQNLDSGYVVTVDNMLKMLSIQLRLRFHLPVIIMGETGCGKSSLIRSMCGALGWPLHTMNVHGGMTDKDIVAWTKQRVQHARRLRDRNEKIVIFFDEVNTTNCMGLFKEMVCDRCMDGERLPDNMCVIAACNPYRLRKTKSLYGGEEMAGLIFEHATRGTDAENVGTGIKDPLRDLVYRVHPLPESMIDHIFDFGALSSETESLYIGSMLRKQLGLFATDSDVEDDARVQRETITFGTQVRTRSFYTLSPFQEFVKVFGLLICSAQECIRELCGGERSAVSLRDVTRCIKVFAWFGNHFYAVRSPQDRWELEDFFCMTTPAEKVVRAATFLALAYTYHARLPREERRTLVNTLSEKWRSLQLQQQNIREYWTNAAVDYLSRPTLPKCRWLRLEAKEFTSVLEDTQRKFVSNMNLGEGIALNEALCENLFMILVSVLNQVPIFVIGKPGSSKSLAMGLVASNLNGDASDSPFLRSLPAVEVFSYQCSPLSTSQGIEQAFEAARRYKQEAAHTVVVVLLDEVGLAEQSPHLPLKVLHKVLDEAGTGEAVVGISNWALDPAKMNRAVHLYRPAPTVEDLSMTAEGMVRSANLKGYLQALARAYNTVYHTQEHPDFWGLREFYSTVRAINAALQRSQSESGTAALDSSMLLNAVLRNFGGRPQELGVVVSKFFEELGLSIPTEKRASVSVENLVVENLNQTEARHLMLLTKNNAALGLLFDRDILQLEKTEIIFGSDFPLDQTDLQICLDIQRIKLCMAEGITVVLVFGERLYESLYDLLNQHYCEYGGQLYVRLAFGTHSRLCPIHKKFRIIVIVEKVEAYTRLAPPLLNRFEKQVFEHGDVLEGSHQSCLKSLHEFCVDFVTGGMLKTTEKSDSLESAAGLMEVRSAFCGFHTDMLSSLMTAATSEIKKQFGPMEADVTDDVIIKECCNRLLWIASPEATCRLLATEEGKRHATLSGRYGEDLSSVYFHQQKHSSLPAFCKSMLDEWSDGFGSQTVIMTYSPLSSNARNILLEQTQWNNVSHVVLHELDQERDLRSKVNDFFSNNDKASEGAILLVQCDPLATSLRRIEHAKFICENARAKFSVAKSKLKANPQLVSMSTQEGDEDELGGVGEEKESMPVDSPEPLEVPEIPTTPMDIDEAAEKSRGTHIVLLLHLPRGSESMYCVSFDTRWRYAFVDSIEPADASGLPEVEAMIGKSMKELVENLHFGKVLRRTVRQSLARLVYTFGRTNESIRWQIELLLKKLEESSFLDCIHKVMNEMLSQTEDTLNVASAAHEERELQLAGTFQAALHSQILETVSFLFAVTLSHMDRNSGLCLLQSEGAQHLWFKLFPVSFWELNIYSIAKSGMMRARTSVSSRRRFGEVEVPSDGFTGKAFEIQFPFSFYLSKILESMRTIGETQGEQALAQQFSLLGLDLEALDDDSLKSYAHDVCCMLTSPISGLERHIQANLFWRILELSRIMQEDGSEEKGKTALIVSLPAIHYLLWKNEQAIQLYFSLMDAVLSAQAQIHSYFLNIATDLSFETNAKVLEIVFSSLNAARQEWKSLADYSRWMQTVDKARSIVISLHDFLGSYRVEAKMAWEKIEFFAVFLRDVAYPLKIEPARVRDIFDMLEAIPLATQAALETVVNVLVGLNRESMRLESDEHICPITLERLVDPVQASDGHTYERSAIEDWFRTGKTTSPKTNLPLLNQSLVANRRLQKLINEELQADVSNFMEYYIFDILLEAGRISALEDTLLCLLVDFITGLSENPNIQTRHLSNILPSEAGKVGLLRELLQISNTSVQKKLAFELQNSVANSGFLDNTLCVFYAIVAEQLGGRPLISDSSNLSMVTELDSLDKLMLLSASHISQDTSIDKILEMIARARLLIVSFAEELSLLLENSDSEPSAILLQRAELVNSLLINSPGNEERVRSMRLFMVKQLERRKGLSFARSALQQEPLISSGWITEWRASNDTGFIRFLGTNRLPQENPLQDVEGFAEMRAMLGSYLSTGSLQQLQEEFRNFVEAAGASSARAGFISALFHEVHLLDVVLDPSDLTAATIIARVSQLRVWILSESCVGLSDIFSPSERKIIALFAGSAGRTSPAHLLIQLDLRSSAEMVLCVRFLAHVVAATLSAPFFAWLKCLMLEPSKLQDSYFPTMPEDLAKMAQTVMGGRWYSCPNGHPFYVDLCGRPTVIQQCAECGADIGGLDHNLLEGNVDLESVGTGYHKTTVLKDNSEKNYCLREAEVEAEDKYFTARTLNPMMVQTVRLVMHAAMIVGLAANGVEWENQAQSVLNRTYCNPSNLTTFVAKHFQSNWQCLRTLLNRSDDDMSFCLHLGLLSSGGSISDEDIVPIVNGEPLPDIPEEFPGTISPEYRTAWEVLFQRSHFQRYLDASDLDEKLERAHTRFNPNESEAGDSGGAFVAEVLEKFEVDALSKEQRRTGLPALWGFRRPFSFQHFAMQLNMLSNQKERHSLLVAFLEQEKELRALSHLPAIFQWLQLLLKKYNRHLDRAAARGMTVGDVLAETSQAERSVWEAAFAGFAAAWNLSWRSVERFGCLQIPAQFVAIQMGLDTPLTFCLPTETDEGICPLALVRYLVERHNNFVQTVDERILLSRRFTHRGDSRTASVSSRHLTSAHTISYDLEGDFIPFLEKRCMSVTGNGGVVYDFKKAEARLLSKYFATVPAIDLELRAFVFAHEQHLSGGLGPLRQKVLQQPLPPDAEEAIKRDITTPAQASQCLELLETAVSFLTATGGSFMKRLDENVGNMMLLQYLRTVLLMEDTTQIGSRAIAQQVQLKHLEALWNLLTQMTELDPFDAVSKKYCEPLSDSDADMFKRRLKSMDIGVLTPLLKSFIVTQLQEETMSSESCAKDIIGWLDTGDLYLMNMQWYSDNWPEALLLKNIVSAYKLLENAMI